MWNNIGNKLKSLAKILCWIGIIGSLAAAIVLWSQNSDHQPTVLMGILYLALGSFFSLIGSWIMYGLGLVVEHVEKGKSLLNQTDENSSLSDIAALAKDAEERKDIAKKAGKMQKAGLRSSSIRGER